MQVYQVLSHYEARQRLNTEGIQFDERRCQTISQGSYCGIEHAPVVFEGLVYFFKDGVEVAYYCAPTSSLTVHDKPRVWCPTFYARTVVY